MAALPPFSRVRREDIPDAPKWIDKIIVPYNNALEAIYLAFNNGLATNNIRCVVRDYSLRPEKMPIVVPWPYTESPVGVFILKARVRDASVTGAAAVPYAPDWTWGASGVTINALQGMTESEFYDIKVLVL
jgi:hypothetical protein